MQKERNGKREQLKNKERQRGEHQGEQERQRKKGGDEVKEGESGWEVAQKTKKTLKCVTGTHL